MGNSVLDTYLGSRDGLALNSPASRAILAFLFPCNEETTSQVEGFDGHAAIDICIGKVGVGCGTPTSRWCFHLNMKPKKLKILASASVVCSENSFKLSPRTTNIMMRLSSMRSDSQDNKGGEFLD